MDKTQPEFAKMIGENVSNLKTYERTGTLPKVHIRKRIAEIAGVTVDDLLKKDLTEMDIKIKDGKDEKSQTTRPQTAQNGANSSQPPVLTRIGEVVKLIQYKTNPTLTIEQIAERIDYSRQTLQTLIKEGDSQKVYDRLQSEFRDVLNDKLTTSTKIPGFEMKPTGTPTVQDVTIKNLSDLAKSQQELVAEMSGKLITLVSKVIDKL